MPAACGCEGTSLAATIRQDIDRYLFYVEVGESTGGRTGIVAAARVALLSPGLWAVVGYRLAHYARRVRPRALGAVVRPLTLLVQQLLAVMTGIRIDARAHIGPGLMIPHGGYIVIGPSRIGRCCDILQGVTVGLGTLVEYSSATSGAVLGDRVWIGPGAVVGSGVKVGSDASVGARSLVMQDVPPCGVVLGMPARVISRRGSFAQVKYRGADDDPDRVTGSGGRGSTSPR
jgi:serine O-acetyltransferase